MASFKQHGQHLAPHVGCLHGFAWLDFAALGFGFVGHVSRFELGTEQVVQIRHIRRREQGPLAFFHHTTHEQVWNPVGCVHVVGTTAVVAGVLAQLEEFFDVQVPCFEVGTHSAFALAALVHRYCGVVDHFQEWHHTL